VAASLAAAFRDNPLNRAAIGGDAARRLRCNLAGMRALLPVAQAGGEVWLAPENRGALVAAPPGRFPFAPPSPWVELRTLVVQGLRARARWARSFEHLQARHPAEPHWYLATLGVHPEAQRRGIGRALVAHLLQRADAEACATYLETDRAANVPFYESFGFRVCEQSEVLETPVWHMHRRPRAD
jgi:ribosomal protein S18 acetylase RimI-like enzyme